MFRSGELEERRNGLLKTMGAFTLASPTTPCRSYTARSSSDAGALKASSAVAGG